LSQGLRSLDYSALLALIGTITAGLLSASFLPDLIFNPIVYVQVFYNGTRTPELLITNDGSRPANNVHAYILAEPRNKIVNITNTFSTAPVNLVRNTTEFLGKDKNVTVNSDTVEILIPTLIQGPGSLAYIRTSFDSENGVKVYTSYDEGSAIGSTQPSIIRSITSGFFAPTASASTLLLVIIIELVSLIPITILVFKLRRRMKRSIIKTLLSNIQENRRKIVKDNSTSEEFINLYRKQKDVLLKKEEREEKWNSRHLELSKLMKNPKDYTIIDDLYTKISERNEKIKTLPEYDKKEVNSECFNLMEKALDIEWNNYR
jgi:hypothetical protein